MDFYTQLQGIDPVPLRINTHHERFQVRLRPLETVQDLVEANQYLPGSPIANTYISNIAVYSCNGTKLEFGSKLSSLATGQTDKTPLILKVDLSTGKRNFTLILATTELDAITRFETACEHELNTRERIVLKEMFPLELEMIKNLTIDRPKAMNMLSRVQTTLKSLTIAHISKEHGYVFGNSIGVGRGTALLLKVVRLKNCQVFCGKVFKNYLDSDGSSFAQNELSISKLVSPHENIGIIEKAFQFSHQSGDQAGLVALLMPLYPMSLDELSKLMNCCPFPFHVFVGVAFGLLSGASRFVEKTLCHGDIKPDNIMMKGLVPILIDLGSVVPLGQAVTEPTLGYSLDADQVNVSPDFDLLCIVSTLVSCILPGVLDQVKTRSDMVDYLEANPNETMIPHVKLCLEILKHASSMIALAALESRFSDVYTEHANFQ